MADIRTKLITELPIGIPLDGEEILPMQQQGVTRKVQTKDVILYTKKQDYATWVNQASTNLLTVDLSSRFIKLYNRTPNDGSNPEFFIGEIDTLTNTTELTSLTGFTFYYDESSNNFVFTSNTSGSTHSRVLTAYYINQNAITYINQLSTSNVLSAKQIFVTDSITISANNNLDGLYIVQTGTGNAVEVFDEINDTTPFVINNIGNVGIKTANPLIDLTINGNLSSNSTLSATNIHLLDSLGIGVNRPNEKLSLLGNLSTRGNIIGTGNLHLSGVMTIPGGAGGDSRNWVSNFNNVCALSARWESVYSYWNPLTANTAQVVSTVNGTSANWNSVYSTWNSTSGFELSARNFINQNNRNIVSNYSHYNANSASFTTYAYTNGFLPLSGGLVTGNVGFSGNLLFGPLTNLVVLGSLTAQKFTIVEAQVLPVTSSNLIVETSGSFGTNLGVAQDVIVGRNMFLSGYFLVPGGAGGDSRNWVSNFNRVCALSARWESNYVHFNTLSSNISQATSYVNNTSATINDVNSYVNTNRINLSQVATTVNSNSANWILNGGNTGAVTVGTNNSTNLTLETNNIARVTVLNTGNVGINQLTPTSILHVTDNSSNPAVLITQAGAGAGLRITQTGSGNALLVEDVDSDTTPFVIDTDGNVGIGASSPTNKLTILSNSNNTTDYPIRINNLSNNYALGVGAYGTSNRIGASTNIDYTFDIGKDLFFKNNNADTVVVKSGGFVGLNTTTPNERLTVVGNVSASNIVYSQVGRFENRNNDYLLIEPSDDSFRFISNGSERMRITSAGRVGVNTTDPATTGIMDIAGAVKFSRTDSINEGGEIQFGRASDNAIAWHIDTFGPSNNPSLRIFEGPSQQQRFQIAGDIGNIVATTTNFEVASARHGSQVRIRATNNSTITNSQAQIDLVTGTPNSFTSVILTEAAAPVVDWSSGPAVTGGLRISTATTSAPIIFRQSTTERARIHTNGFFGINTATPVSELHVSGVTTTNHLVTPNFGVLGINLFFDPSQARWEYLDNGHGYALGQTSDNLTLWYAPNNTTGNNTAATISARITLNTSGDVGIGSTTPNQKLTVVGNISSNAIVYDGRGNSTQWNSVFSTFQANSANYQAIRGIITITDAGTTIVNGIPAHNPDGLDIFLNGVKLVLNYDYDDQANLNRIVLTEPTKAPNYVLEYVIFGAVPTYIPNVVPLSGGTMSGNLTVPTLNVGSNATIKNLVISREDSSLEGGQIGLARASDNSVSWYIDAYNNTSTPDFRIFNSGTVAFTIEGSTRNVGINVSNPSARLQVYQENSNEVGLAVSTAANNTGDALWVMNAGSGHGMFLGNTGSGNALTINNTGNGNSLVVNDENGDTTSFIIDNAGRVGIGKYPGLDIKLDVFGESTTPGSNSEFRISSTSGGVLQIHNNIAAGAWGGIVRNNDKAIVYFGDGGQNTGGFSIQQWSNTTTPRGLRIDPTGNVGISTGSPNERLTVVGNISATGTIFGDGTGLRNLDLSKKWYSFVDQRNFCCTSRTNCFISADRRLYVAGGTSEIAVDLNGLGSPRASNAAWSGEIPYPLNGFVQSIVTSLNSGEVIEKVYTNVVNKYVLTNQKRLHSIGVNNYGTLGTNNAAALSRTWAAIDLPNVRDFSVTTQCQNGFFTGIAGGEQAYNLAPWYGMVPWCFAITEDGRLFGWGWEGGTGFATAVRFPTLYTVGDIVNKNLMKVYTQCDQYTYSVRDAALTVDNGLSSGVTFCIDSDRNLYARGLYGRGILGIDGARRNNFTQVPGGIKADELTTGIWNGQGTTFILDGTRLLGTGTNIHGQLAIPSTTVNRNNFAEVFTNVRSFASGGRYNGTVAVIRTDGRLLMWGGGQSGLLGRGNTSNSHIPQIPNGLENITFKKVLFSNGTHPNSDLTTVYALADNGELWACGWDRHGQMGRGPFTPDVDSGENMFNNTFKKVLIPPQEKVIDFCPWGYLNGSGVLSVTESGAIYSNGWANYGGTGCDLHYGFTNAANTTTTGERPIVSLYTPRKINIH
jgi:hypothetical protein